MNENKPEIVCLTLGMTQTNCYMVSLAGSTEAVVIDPADRGDAIHRELEKRNLRAAAIFLTHGHFDHILGANELRNLTGAKIYAAAAEKPICEDAALNYSRDLGCATTVIIDGVLAGGEERMFAGMTWRILATPGHTAGSLCFLLADDGILFSGDTIFRASVGRTDLHSGDMATLVCSIREQLLTLADTTVVYPGHGDATGIGEEKTHNPFI